MKLPKTEILQYDFIELNELTKDGFLRFIRLVTSSESIRQYNITTFSLWIPSIKNKQKEINFTPL